MELERINMRDESYQASVHEIHRFGMSTPISNCKKMSIKFCSFSAESCYIFRRFPAQKVCLRFAAFDA